MRGNWVVILFNEIAPKIKFSIYSFAVVVVFILAPGGGA